MHDSLKDKTVKGTVWSSIERFSVQGVSFVVMILMARILTPKDYGLVGMIAVFIAVSQALVDSGFSQALIRKQDRSEVDNSTVFYFNIGVGIILYSILFFCAVPISRFYNEPLLVPITRLVSLSVLLNSFVVVQRALLTVKLDFKTQAKASVTASVVAGGIGVYIAYSGFGIWSIVWYQLANISVNVGLLWLLSHWRPAWAYSWKSFKELFSFGSKMAASSILETVYQNLYLIVIGKVFKPADLGYYTRAQQFAAFPSSNLTGILGRVSFPALCTIQDDLPRLQSVYRRFLRVSAFVVFPLMVGLAAVAKPLVLVVLKEQWLFSATLLSIICFGMMWYPIHAINLNLLQVRGRSDLFLKLEIIKKILGVIVLAATVPFGLIWMCVGTVVSSIVSLVINTHYTGKLIHVGFSRQMKDLLPTLFYSLSMGVIVWMVVQAFGNPWLQLISGVGIGAVYLFFITYLTHSKDLRELIALVRKK